MLYNPSGHFSSIVGPTDPKYRPEGLGWPAQPGQSDAQWALIGKHCVAYTGRFRFDGSVQVQDVNGDSALEGQIVHGPLDVATMPALEGMELRRDFTLLLGNEGKATLLNLRGGESRGSSVNWWWERVK